MAQDPVKQLSFGDRVPRERQGGMFGVGMGIGAPTGATVKAWVGDWMGVQAAVGGDLGHLGDFATTADYLFHFRPFSTGTNEYSVPVYLGVGVNLSSNTYEEPSSIFFGTRAVVGTSVLVRELPIEMFFEAAPTFFVYQDLTWAVDGQIGVRYYL
tara:strand:+ start:116 stop:580 length:465 start_codon:yes stop_codon:yes gene_type:complete